MAVSLKLFMVAIVMRMYFIMDVHCNKLNDDFNDALRKQEVTIKTFSNAYQTSILRDSKTKPVFGIFCYEPEAKLSIRHLWATAHLKVEALSDGARYAVYRGENESVVYERRVISAMDDSVVLTQKGFREIALHPYRKSCAGIDTSTDYRLELLVTAVNTKLVITFVAGLLLFLFAPVFGRATLTYYVLGMTVGIATSVLIVLYIVSRMFLGPKMLTVSVLAGSSLTLWAMNLVWNNFAFFFHAYHTFFVSYIIGAVVTSFAVCYYIGPPENERFYDLVVWAVQAFGLVLVYTGSQISEMSVTVVAMLVLSQIARWFRSKD